MQTKMCSMCHNYYPANAEYFHRKHTTKDGLHSSCKKCRNERNKIGFKQGKKPKDGFRICSKCGRELELTDKYFQKRSGKIFQGVCKECKGGKFRQLTTIKNGMKRCSKCDNQYPATTEYFFKNNAIKCGLNSQCKQCSLEWRNNNKDAIKKYSQAYAKENRERYRLKEKERREKNPEKYHERNKAYYMENREKNLKRYKEYYHKNAEEIRKRWKIHGKKYYNKNRDKLLIKAETRRQQKINGIVDFDESKWDECKNFFEHKCCYCGKETKLTQDHFVPFGHNGEYSKNNIIPACFSCNSSKNDSDFFEWYPRQLFYSKSREKKILKYLHYDPKTKYQQLAL